MKTSPKYLTQDELRRSFDTIESPRDRALFGLSYHYGLRVDEATAITTQDLALKNHRIRIRRLKNGIGGEKPLWRHTAKLLRAYIRVRKDAGLYLFTGREAPHKKRMVQKLFVDYAEDAGIEGPLHGLRHSIAVHLLEAGRGIRVFQPMPCPNDAVIFTSVSQVTMAPDFMAGLATEQITSERHWVWFMKLSWR